MLTTEAIPPLFAAARGKRPETVAVLLKAKANTKHRNNRGETVAEMVKSKPQKPERKKILSLLRR